MGCGCGTKVAAAKSNVQKYTVTDDPDKTEYLTEREALVAKSTQGLSGEVVPVQ